MTSAFDTHNHAHCVQSGLAELERHCREQKLKLTPIRRRVFEILQQQHKAMGAYDILDVLRNEGLGSQPPVAYRALEFLVSHGFAHKIEGLNAFVACAHPEQSHVPAFMICKSCDRVAETEAPAMSKQASRTGFAIESTVVEAIGICSNCVEANP